MAKTATVSFKVSAEEYTILQVLAAQDGKALSTFIRDTVDEALDLEAELARLAELMGKTPASLSSN
jgi:predicted DNA-binding protein